MYYLNLGDSAIVGSSPEILTRVMARLASHRLQQYIVEFFQP
jgi:anthranilate/para-aminobenzoate synthase component I